MVLPVSMFLLVVCLFLSAFEARASLLVPSSAVLLKRRSQGQHAPPSPQAPLARRLPRLSSRLYSLGGWRANACSCSSLERGEKQAGSS
jgi:hypothetical protein